MVWPSPWRSVLCLCPLTFSLCLRTSCPCPLISCPLSLLGSGHFCSGGGNPRIFLDPAEASDVVPAERRDLELCGGREIYYQLVIL